ncbi:hypothetical protein AT984_10375 [Paucibacter sp. KCTC 42545]|nr:hypothetical protein AT984_10375 [Paucibacter sp. KCTC 42545]
MVSGALYPCLVADIGGTNARFGWLAARHAPVSHVTVLPVREHSGPVAAANAYLHGLRQQLGDASLRPSSAAFAVATAVAGDQVELTNSHWSFSRRQVQQDLRVSPLLVLNDFEALALSLPHLGDGQLRAWVAGDAVQPYLPASAAATMAVIGPGTGLGVAGVTPTPQGWIALPCEGGHASLSAADDFESALLAHVRTQYAHVSAERLLSGIGLPVLHAAVVAVMSVQGAQGKQGEQAHVPLALSSEQIVARGLSGEDPLCAQTLDSFCALLGSFAGNVALILGARGGVYIGGGIVPRLGERFFASRFRERFEAKGRFQTYLAAIPTALITDTLAALTGAAAAIEQLGD